jgi:hypothetical protein
MRLLEAVKYHDLLGNNIRGEVGDRSKLDDCNASEESRRQFRAFARCDNDEIIGYRQ